MITDEEVTEIHEELNAIKHESFAMELLKDQRKQNKRLFIICIITFIAFVGLLCYTIWLLNDTGTITTTDTQDIKNVDYIGNTTIRNGN